MRLKKNVPMLSSHLQAAWTLLQDAVKDENSTRDEIDFALTELRDANTTVFTVLIFEIQTLQARLEALENKSATTNIVSDSSVPVLDADRGVSRVLPGHDTEQSQEVGGTDTGDDPLLPL